MFPHICHRWSAPRAPRTEVRQGSWDLTMGDRLHSFLSSLPPPLRHSKRSATNPKGGDAEIQKLVYAYPSNQAPQFYHGTTYHAIHSIITKGLRASTNAELHEFTTPGVYVANYLEGALFHHATATRFCTEEMGNIDLPWVRFLCIVEGTSSPIKTKSYRLACSTCAFSA